MAIPITIEKLLTKYRMEVNNCHINLPAEYLLFDYQTAREHFIPSGHFMSFAE